MDAEHRRQLEQRRHELQAEQDRRERQELIRGETDLLDARHVPYELVYDTGQHLGWVAAHFPCAGSAGRVVWDEVPGHRCLADPDEPTAARWLEQVAGGSGSGEDEVVVLWSNGRYPGLRLRFADLLDCPEVVASYFEVWVVHERGGWLVEYTFERGWCWGPAG